MRTLYFEGAGWSGADSSKATIGKCRIRTAFHLDDGRVVYLEILCGYAPQKKKSKKVPPVYYGYVDALYEITDDVDNNDCNRHNLLGERRRKDPFAYTLDEILHYVNGLGASFDAVAVVPDLGGYRVFREKWSEKGTERYNYGDEFRFDAETTARREAVYREIYQLEKDEGKKYPNFSLWADEKDAGMLHLLRHYNGFNKHWTIRTDTGSTLADWMKTAEETKLGRYGC